MLLHMLHAEVNARRVALYDATVRDELVLRAWRTGGWWRLCRSRVGMPGA